MSEFTAPAHLIPADLDLVGLDGNAFAIIGTVRRELRRAGNTPEDIAAVTDAMMDSDYDHLLRVAIAVTT